MRMTCTKLESEAPVVVLHYKAEDAAVVSTSLMTSREEAKMRSLNKSSLRLSRSGTISTFATQEEKRLRKKSIPCGLRIQKFEIRENG